MTRTGCLIVAALLLPIVVAVLLGLPFIAEIEACLLVGWTVYLWKILPQVRLGISGVATSALSGVLAVYLAHRFLNWLYPALRAAPNSPSSSEMGVDDRATWRWKWTIYGFCMVIVIFTAGVCAVGIVHQVGWILSSPIIGSGK